MLLTEGIQDDFLADPTDPFHPYRQINREERQFCALLMHLLVARGDNLRRFLALVDERLLSLGLRSFLGDRDESLEQAEVYVEFAYLRDRWAEFDATENGSLQHRNDCKRDFLQSMFARIPGLASLYGCKWPTRPAEFNKVFMGSVGLNIRGDIASPVHWRVSALHDLAISITSGHPADERLLFRDLCRFKWAFNIKPDIVISIPGLRPLCIEAKALSPESRYPTRFGDAQIFDRVFGPKEGRVGQVELQDFLVRYLLKCGSQGVLIDRTGVPIDISPDGVNSFKVPAITWENVYERMDFSRSLSFVNALSKTKVMVSDVPATEPSGPPTTKLPFYDGTEVGLAAILTLIIARDQVHYQTDVGFQGGIDELRTQAIEALIVRRWKWRDPMKPGNVRRENWIDGKSFEKAIEDLRLEQQSGN